MKIENLLLLSCTLAGGMAVEAANKQAHVANHPNLLYIFPDQYRMQALSIWSNPEYREAINTLGDPVHTPNLDRLAKKGVLFNQATSTHPMSSPYRGMFLSGMYPHDNGIEDLNCKIGRKQELHQDAVCLTDVLAKEGYETAYVGKTHWHKTEALFDEAGTFVGTTEKPGGSSIGPFDTYVPAGPSRHSNQFWFQQLNDNHYNPMAYSNRPELIGGKKDGECYRPHTFSSKVEADIVIQYLENNHGERRGDKPFSVIWALNPPHPPYFKLSDCDSTVYNTFYKDMALSELLNRPNVKLGAQAGDHTAGKNQHIDQMARIYFSLIKSVDEQIGRVLDCLDEIGQTNNTIVVFTSDHGDMMGSQGLTGKPHIYDECFLVPYIISYPGKISKPHVDDLMFGTVDIMPTLLGMMNLGDKIPATAVGKDYSQGIMTGKYKKGEKPESALYLSMGAKGVRTYEYTYLVNKDGSYKLYQNKKDPYQMHSLQLDAIPAKDALFLKTSLGDWLKKSHDGWYRKKMHKELISYPAKSL